MSPRLRTDARPVPGPPGTAPAPRHAGAPLWPLLPLLPLLLTAALTALAALLRTLLPPEPATGPFARDAGSPR